MKRAVVPAVLALSFAAQLGGCSGGGGSIPAASGAAPAQSGAETVTRHRGGARFEIRIPKRRRRAHYVSPNTQSMQVLVNGKLVGTYALNATSPACSQSNGSLQCTATIEVPSGTDTFTVTTFATSDATGSPLSTGSVTQTVKAGSLAVVPLTLGGVVASIGVTLGNASPGAGAAATTPVYVTAFDASNAMIVGPGDYSHAIALTNSDASGITTLSTATVAGPGTSVSLAYTGASIVSASIGASDGTVTATPATFAPAPRVFTSFPVPPSLGNSGAYAIAPGPDGNVWYTTSGAVNAVVRLTPAGVQTVYIGGLVPNLTPGSYFGIATGPDGNLWITDNVNDAIYSLNPTTGAVSSYAAPAGTCPNRIIAGPPSDGGLWFTSHCATGSGAVGHISTLGVATATPLTGASRTMEGITLGSDGHLYAVDQGGGQIFQIVIGGGAVSSYSALAIPANPLDGSPNAALLGIAQTSDGQLWFTNSGCQPNTLGSIAIASTFTASAVHEFTAGQGCTSPAFLTPAARGSVLFEGVNVPEIEEVSPAGTGVAPVLTDYAFSTPTNNGVPQQTFDITVGPNGNVWSTVNRIGSTTGGNIVEMAY